MDALKTFGKTARGAWIGWIGLLALVGLLVVTGHLASKLRPDKMYKWLFNIATIATCWAQFPNDFALFITPNIGGRYLANGCGWGNLADRGLYVQL